MNMIPSPLTMQNAIEYAIPLLVKQNCKSKDYFGDFRYNSEMGHCVVGFIIRPQDYKEFFDTRGLPAGHLLKYIEEFRPLSIEFLAKFQVLHDGATVEFKSIAFKQIMVAFCNRWQLDTKFLEEIEFV